MTTERSRPDPYIGSAEHAGYVRQVEQAICEVCDWREVSDNAWQALHDHAWAKHAALMEERCREWEARFA